jgi:hypothetical protein
MLRRISGGLATALLSCGACWSIRLAYADHLASQWTRSALERAVRLAPLNAAYYVRWAEIDPGGAVVAIRKAVALNPKNSSIWIEFGRIAETNREFQTAENSLLTAVRLDNGFAPRWLLAAYYYRRRDVERFWPAVRAALSASYDDVAPLFRMCWDLAADPDVVLDAMPERGDVLRQYLDFVLAQGRVDVAGPVAAKLVERASLEDLPCMLRYCDRLLGKDQAQRALGVWNLLCRRRLLNYPAPLPGQGGNVTNGHFENPLLSHGFDWRLPEREGVWTVRFGPPVGIRFNFSGGQPEKCEILSQVIPLDSGRHYLLIVRYQTGDLPSQTGLCWRVLDGTAGNDLLNGTGSLPPSEGGEHEEQYRYDAPIGTESAKLALAYERSPGTARITGSLCLRNVSVSLAE